MKRILCLISVLLLIMLTACSNASSTATIGGADGPTSIFVSEEKEEVNETKEEVNESNTEEVELTEDGRVVVYWANPSLRDSSDVCYHTKTCELIKDLQPHELPWELIEALNMEPCKKCNPDK